MASRSTFLYDLKDEIKDNINIDNIISSVVVGEADNILGWYDPDKIYNIGDIIPHITEDGKLVMLICKENGVTGEFDISKWDRYDLISEMKKMYDYYIIQAPVRPKEHRLNKVWLQVKSESLADIDWNEDLAIVIYNNFIVSETEPEPLLPGTIWGHITEIE